MQDLIALIRTELRGAWRYRWVAMVVAWVVCLFGWVGVYAMPNIYDAHARIYVNSESPLRDAMKRINVSTGSGSNLFVIRQAMLGRPQLEKVAQETDLILRARDSDEKDLLILDLADKISIGSGRSKQAANLYTISFEDRDPAMAIAVVRTLLDTFVEDMLDRKGQGTGNAQEFYEENLALYAKQLADDELRLAEFKKKYVGMLPGESGGVFEKLQAQMDVVSGLRQEVANEINKRDELQSQLRGENPYADEGTGTAVAGVPSNPTEARIAELNSQLSSLLLRFTERHPDVIAIQEQLEQLAAQRRKDIESMAAAGGMDGVTNSTNPVYQSTQIALNETKVTIAGLQSQLRQNEALERRLRNQVETIPEIEAEYSRLTRGYTQTTQLYNDLKLEAERLRLTRAGEASNEVDFEITEPPIVSSQPVSPKRALLIIGVLILGLGAGGGVAFLISQMHPVFHDAQTLRKLTGRPVLGVVSMTMVERHRNERRLSLASLSIAGAGLLVLFVGSLVFQDAGVELMQSLKFQLSG